jgi:hypothetical protein
MFWRNISSPSSGSKNKTNNNLAEASGKLSKLCMENQAVMDQPKLERNCERAIRRVSSVCKGTLRTHGSKRYDVWMGEQNARGEGTNWLS